MKTCLTVFLALLLAPATGGAVGGHGHGRGSRETHLVRIAAASDLRFALDDALVALRTDQPDLDVRVTYGSSGTFFAQLRSGAPFDVFMSADTDYPRQLAMAGLTVAGSEFTYAVGRLVLWVRRASPLDLEQLGMRALLDSRVSHIAIANPATAPYGRAAEAAIRRAGLYERAKDRIVLGETVAQAFQFVQSGAADIGIVALSLALAPSVAGDGRYVQLPLDAYPRMDQSGVIMKSAADIAAARRVLAFLASAEGRARLKRYGFFAPGA